MKKRILSFVLALAIVLPSAVIPAFAASSGQMTKQKETEHFVFAAMDQDKNAVEDLAKALEDCYERVTIDLKKAPTDKTIVEVYPDLASYHRAIGQPNAPDWSVGQYSLNDKRIRMVSPNNPGSSHDYEGVLEVAVHEYVHRIVDLYGNQPSYLHEGVASYEAGQKGNVAIVLSDYRSNKLPKVAALNSFNTTSGDDRVYVYGYAYIDFVVRNFGFDKVIALLEGKSRTTTLGKSEDELNKMWYVYLLNGYVYPDSLDQVFETEHIIFRFTKQDSAVVKELAERLENKFSKITFDLKKDFGTKTAILIYPDIASFHKGIGKPDADDSNVILSTWNYARIAVVSPQNPGTHYTSDTVIGKLEIDCAFRVPILFEKYTTPLVNGIAAYEFGITGRDSTVQETVNKAVEENKLPNLSELEDLRSIYFSYAYVDFIVQEYGYDGLISLLNGKTLTEVSKLSAQQLNEKWLGFLKNAYTTAPNLDTADSWAQAEITSAVNKGFVPTELQNNYKSVISREQFCQMAVMYLEYATGKEIGTILSEKGLAIDSDAFADTKNEYILAAYALGITNGSGKNEAGADVFAPKGSITREMAATMLTRLSKVLGKDTENAVDAGYTDINEASNWAVNSINFCYANSVMNGTSQTPLKFSPKETYTIQQSIATFDRMK